MVDVSEGEVFILELLDAGHVIRRIDGRWPGGFVDLDALQALIDVGKAQTFLARGMTFVRKPVRHQDRPRHKSRRR